MADQRGAEHTATAPAATNAPSELPTAPQQAQQTTQGPAVSYAQYPNAYGQAYSGYNQYGYNYAQPAYSQPYSHAPQALAPETKANAYGKMGLHAAGALFSLLALCLSFALIPSRWGYMAGITAPVPAVALIWSVAELIVRKVHNFQTGIHPGGHVAVCLLIWLVQVIINGSEWTYFAIMFYSNDCTQDTYETNTYGNSEQDVGNCYEPWHGKRGIWGAISVFSTLVFVVYFTLFIMACIDTAKRNAAKRVVMVVNQPYYAPQAGWQQLPQQNAPTQQSQYAAAPQPTATRGALAQQSQDIPLQNRTPSPATPYETPMEMEEAVNEKGKGPAVAGPSQGGIREFYGN